MRECFIPGKFQAYYFMRRTTNPPKLSASSEIAKGSGTELKWNWSMAVLSLPSLVSLNPKSDDE
jgi:hypothetical protein